MREVKIGMVYKHFRGNKCLVLDMATDVESRQKYVVYAWFGKDGLSTHQIKLYSAFTSKVDCEKYPEATQKYCFEEMRMI